MGVDAELLFLGCYTGESGDGEGIVAVHRDPRTGALSGPRLVARTASPSFLARHPGLPVLYAVNELPDGTVGAWSVDAGGALSELAVRPTGGASPCHLAVTADGRHLLSANYGSGSVAVHPLDADGVPGERTDLVTHAGSGPDAERQEGPHAHMVSPDPHGADVLAVDLGADRVFRHRLDAATGRLTELPPAVLAPAGAGPRHLVRHPDGRTVLVVDELDAALAAYLPGPDAGPLQEVARVPATTRGGAVQPSEVAVRADGRFAYVANRGPDTVAVFAVDGDRLSPVVEVDAGGRWPRHLALVGDHLYVANERSHNVTIFRLHPATGAPEPAGLLSDVGSPTCVFPWITV